MTDYHLRKCMNGKYYLMQPVKLKIESFTSKRDSQTYFKYVRFSSQYRHLDFKRLH